MYFCFFFVNFQILNRELTGMNTANNANDQELWCALQKGDQLALGCIFDKYVYVLYSYGAQITKDYPLIEDCIQDVFVELWQRHASLSETTSIKFYLFKSLRRRILRRLNQQQPVMSTNSAFREEIIFSYETQLIAQQASEENQQKLSRVLNALSEKQKKVIFLKYYDKLSYEEIAKIMSMDTKAVYDLVYHSIKTLKKHFQKAVLTLLYILASSLFV